MGAAEEAAELQAKLARREKLRKERAKEEAKAKREAGLMLDEKQVVHAVLDSAPPPPPPRIPQVAEKVPYAVGKKPSKTKPKGCGLTKRLIAVMDVPAYEIEATNNYCEFAGINPKLADVGDCLVHNLLHWTMKGSAPHMKEVMERIDGKVAPSTDQSANGKMSITDAMNMIEHNKGSAVDQAEAEAEEGEE
jgi:hypothetical protein